MIFLTKENNKCILPDCIILIDTHNRGNDDNLLKRNRPINFKIARKSNFFGCAFILFHT